MNDGFDGIGSYQQGGRIIPKFGPDNLGEDPSKTFGLPILSKTSTNIINYSIGFDNLDAIRPASGNQTFTTILKELVLHLHLTNRIY